MENILPILSLIISTACLLCTVVILFIIKNQKNSQQPSKDNFSALSNKVDRLGTVLDYTNKSIGDLSHNTEYRMNNIQSRLSDDLKYMSEMNSKNLETIRNTVDEKLTATLEGQLGKSYQLISERLEAVYKGLGEVHSLAGNVSDIKKVFSNVKLRGTWGEAQLNTLLSQMLSPSQYQANVKLNPLSDALVDFAVKLPSKDEEVVYLPIDSKFPIEEYQRLLNASDACNKEGEEKALNNLEKAVKKQALSICEKYIQPPRTTDFAILYLPLEGLYAEILKMPGLNDFLYEKRIMICGPTNLGALLSTLQTGFKTAAIEKRSGELWQLLAIFKHEFLKFSELLDKTQKKLQEAQDSIDSASKKTKTIAKKLKNVDEISNEDILKIDNE